MYYLFIYSYFSNVVNQVKLDESVFVSVCQTQTEL